MPAMLGEMLLKAGALTEKQLEQVLNAQSIYGGRLGTNLVEMGLVEEDALARVLSEKLGVPFIEANALDAVPREVLSVVPLEAMQHHHVLPVALDGRRLTLAMVDPSDFAAIDEVGFVTGLVIVPRVCPELRLSIALEHYFGIKRTTRYIPVEGGARTRFAAANAQHWDAAAQAGKVPGQKTQPQGGSSWKGATLAALAEKLAGAPGEAQVVSALLWYLGSEFDRACFLRLKSGAALGVRAVASGHEVDGFAGYAVELDEARQLKWVVQQRRLFLGEFPAEGAVGALMQAMEGNAPAAALVLPVAVGSQVAAVICVNDEKGRLSGGVFELQRVAAMAELAFEMLRIRKRIRAV